MKKIVMIVSVAIASIGFSFAQQGQTQQERGQQQQQQGQMGQEGMQEIDRGDMDKIDRNELPGQVQNTLRTGEFRDWEVDEVYRVQPEKQRETGVAYMVKVKKGEEKMKLQYDQDGNLVGKHSKDKDEKGHKSGDKTRKKY